MRQRIYSTKNDNNRIAAAALHGRPDEYFLLRVRGDSKRPLY